MLKKNITWGDEDIVRLYVLLKKAFQLKEK